MNDSLAFGVKPRKVLATVDLAVPIAASGFTGVACCHFCTSDRSVHPKRPVRVLDFFKCCVSLSLLLLLLSPYSIC